MKINHLELTNWRCFEKKKVVNFKNHELITMENGTGKTSIFDAIGFAIWGKAPIGFNFNTVRFNDEKPCRIYIEFEMNNFNRIDNYTIERIFGSANSNNNIAELKINDELICESTRNIESFMNKIINYNICSQLWSSSLINTSILDKNFFTK